jgi:beta-glucanase (GH16 family)
MRIAHCVAVLALTASLPACAAGPSFFDTFGHFSGSADGGTRWMTVFPYGPPATRTLPGNHEAECYMDSSVGFNPFADSGSILSIAATPASGGNPCNLPYNSGLITTYRSFSQLYGTFIIRAKLPAGQGLWPAWWFLPADNQYSSELDAFEVLGNDPSSLYFTLHGCYNAAAPDGCGWRSISQKLSVPDTSAGFHVYSLTWTPKTVSLAMDGAEIGHAPTPFSMNTPMYMLINLAVGGNGSWPGPPNSSTVFPAVMQVDWVRVLPLPPARH